jgi:hypothetical protein
MPLHTIRDAEPEDEARVREIVGSILEEFGMALESPGMACRMEPRSVNLT